MKHPSPIELSRALVEGVDDRLRAHLDVCDRCNEELAAHASVTMDVRQLPVVDPDDVHARQLRGALLAAARAPQPLPRPRMVWGFVLAGGLAAAAIAMLLVFRTPSEPARVARAVVKPHEGAALVHIEAPDEVVRLSEGTVTVQVAQLEARERFRVVTGDAELESRDAAFDVRVERDHLRAVRVYAGRVEIRADGAASRTVSAGERWELELAQQAPAPVPASEVPAPVLADEPPAVDAPVVVATTPEPKRAPRPAPRAPEKFQNPGKDTIVQAPARAKRPIEVLFDEGWTTLTSGDPRAAAPIFERAERAAPDDPLAEDASFWRSSALVRARSGDAASALERFLSRYPGSPRVGEASAMLGWLVIDRDLDRAERLFRNAETDRVGSVRASATRGLAAVAARRAR